MSSATFRLPAIAGTISFTAALVGAFLHPAVREFITRLLGTTVTSKMLKALVAVVALLNFKNLPGVWHIRTIRGILYQLHFQRKSIPPKHLFAPIITSSYNTLYDCDYNIHKSNSTYFADLDVARAHAMSAILRVGLNRLNKGDSEGLPQQVLEAKGQYVPALGAVSCFFQREIAPLQAFEIYTRVLSWDRKWIYVVSHVVKKGAIKPDSYVLQPWKRSQRREDVKADEDLSKHIYATSLARYVFKKGRLTINPEIVLERSRLLPPRPAGVDLPPRAEASGAPTPVTPATPAGVTASPENLAGNLNSKLGNVAAAEMRQEIGDWSWEDMEKERLRGLELANHFDALGGLHRELKGDEVLGKFGDYW